MRIDNTFMLAIASSALIANMLIDVAADNYDEAVSGDLSASELDPVFSFTPGNNTIRGSAYTYVGGALDDDSFSFSIDPGHSLEGIFLTLTNPTTLQTTVEVGPTFVLTPPDGGLIGTGGIDAVTTTQTIEIFGDVMPLTGAAGTYWWSSGGYIFGTPPRGGSWDYLLEFHVSTTTDDTDGDGAADDLDNCVAQANPLQSDGDGDGYGNACDGDFNNDCTVNSQDLGLLRQAFFSSNASIDLSEDGIVNVTDLGLLKVLFFQTPGPSALADHCQ